MAKEGQKIKNIIKDIVYRLEKNNVKIAKLILYGSYANGSHKSYSDIDIAVISPSFENKNILKRQELLGDILFELGEPVEALGYTLREYRNPAPMSFLCEILSTGKTVYDSQKFS